MEGFTGSEGDDLDPEEDGTLNTTPWTSIVDSVAVSDGDGGDVSYSETVLAPGINGNSFPPGGASRIPDGTDSDTAADWARNEFTSPGAASNAAPGEAQNTPGASNLQVPVTPVINEFVFNHQGADTNEFVEVLGAPDTDYSNLWLIQIEGDGNGAGTIDSAIQLGTTDADGFWTTGFLTNEFENGTATILLVEGFTGSEGDDVDPDEDGTLDSTPWTSIVDSVAVNDGSGSNQTYSETVLGSDIDGASRIPDGTDTDTADDWIANEFTDPGDPSDAAPGEARNTPGSSNIQEEIPATEVTIMQIQGAGHTSAFVGQSVTTSGIVTALAADGFYIQDPDGRRRHRNLRCHLRCVRRKCGGRRCGRGDRHGRRRHCPVALPPTSQRPRSAAARRSALKAAAIPCPPRPSLAPADAWRPSRWWKTTPSAPSIPNWMASTTSRAWKVCW